jgi:hypothetical protein
MLIPIGLFLLSMEDYYVPAISGAPLPVVGAALIWFSCQSFRQARLPEIILASFILVGAVVGFCRVLYDPSIEIWPSNFVGWLVGFIILMTDLSGKKAQIDRGIRLFLVIHVGFFFLQAFIYLLFHYYIDPVSWLTGVSSRYQEQGLREITLIVPIRPTGMFVEPSNYATNILPIALLYYIQRGRISLLVAASLASVALTYSSWAFFAVATSFVLFTNRKASSVIAVGMITVFLTFSANWFMVRTFETRYGTDRDTPAEFRLIFAEDVLEDAANFSPGLGIGVRDAGLGGLVEYTINDSGAAIYFVYVFGLSALVVLLALIWGARGWRNKIVLALILSSKLTPTYPFFWLLMNMIMRNAPNREARECQALTPPQNVIQGRDAARASRPSAWPLR